MKKIPAKALIYELGCMASRAEQISSYIILYEDQTGQITRISSGSQMAQIGLLETAKARTLDHYRDTFTCRKDDDAN